MDNLIKSTKEWFSEDKSKTKKVKEIKIKEIDLIEINEKNKIDELILEYKQLYDNKPTKELSDLLVLLKSAKFHINNLGK